jgi:hypothetical protein
MERYCNRLKPLAAIRSRHFPYAALDWYVLEDAQLTQIKCFYSLSTELSLRASRNEFPKGSLVHEACKCWIVHLICTNMAVLCLICVDPSCILLPPPETSCVHWETRYRHHHVDHSCSFNKVQNICDKHLRSGPSSCWLSEAPGNGGAWAIIDRSGTLARAIYEEELDADE